MSAEAVWIGWLALFLIYEIYGAVAKTKYDTLSENVWDWFGVKTKKKYGFWRRGILAVFMGVLTFHFVLGSPGGWAVILGAIPMAAVIGYALIFERKDRNA